MCHDWVSYKMVTVIQTPLPIPKRENTSLQLNHMINPRISANWNTTKPIATFSCKPRVQEEHTKAEGVHLTPGLLGLGVLFNCHA